MLWNDLIKCEFNTAAAWRGLIACAAEIVHPASAGCSMHTHHFKPS